MELNSLIPELKASNFAHSLAFYTGYLGFRIEYERPERQFAMLSYQGCQRMLEQANDTWKTGIWNIHLGEASISKCPWATSA